MKKKAFLSKTNLNRYIAVGGIGLAVFGATYYVYGRISRWLGTLSKGLMLWILTKTKRELFPLWNTMSGEILGSLVTGNPKNPSPQYKREVLERGKPL